MANLYLLKSVFAHSSQWGKKVANLYLLKSVFAQSFLNLRPEPTMDMIHVWSTWKDWHIIYQIYYVPKYHISLVKQAGVR